MTKNEILHAHQHTGAVSSPDEREQGIGSVPVPDAGQRVEPVSGPTHPKMGRIGMVARWQPVHLGHAPVLRALCEQADLALIGLGSSNRYNVRHPFSLEETTDMLKLALDGYTNYQLIAVPDLDDGPRWRRMVVDLFGPLDAYVSANPYVASLLAQDYRLIRPVELLAQDERIALDGSMVRTVMAQGGDWKALLPAAIADYITTRRLDERFRREFGLQTLALNNLIQHKEV